MRIRKGILGIDIGFAGTKACFSEEFGKKVVVEFPSATADPTEGGIETGDVQREIVHVQDDEERTLLSLMFGETAQKLGDDATPDLSANMYYGLNGGLSLHYVGLLCAGIAKAKEQLIPNNGEEWEIVVGLGCAISHYNLDLAHNIYQGLVNHPMIISLEGQKPFKVTITHLIFESQPLWAICSQMLRFNGKPAQDKSWLNDPVVFDIGSLTSHIVPFVCLPGKNGRKELTAKRPHTGKGMWSLEDPVRELLRDKGLQQFERGLSPWDIMQILRSGKFRSLDLSEDLQGLYDRKARQVIADAGKTIGDGAKAGRVLLVGGGQYRLASYLRHRYHDMTETGLLEMIDAIDEEGHIAYVEAVALGAWLGARIYLWSRQTQAQVK